MFNLYSRWYCNSIYLKYFLTFSVEAKIIIAKIRMQIYKSDIKKAIRRIFY